MAVLEASELFFVEVDFEAAGALAVVLRFCVVAGTAESGDLVAVEVFGAVAGTEESGVLVASEALDAVVPCVVAGVFASADFLAVAEFLDFVLLEDTS